MHPTADANDAKSPRIRKTVRMQRFPDGTVHKVEAGVVQRESWKRTAEGWMMYRVDNIQEGYLLVDDKPYKPNQ